MFANIKRILLSYDRQEDNIACETERNDDESSISLIVDRDDRDIEEGVDGYFEGSYYETQTEEEEDDHGYFSENELNQLLRNWDMTSSFDLMSSKIWCRQFISEFNILNPLKNMQISFTFKYRQVSSSFGKTFALIETIMKDCIINSNEVNPESIKFYPIKMKILSFDCNLLFIRNIFLKLKNESKSFISAFQELNNSEEWTFSLSSLKLEKLLITSGKTLIIRRNLLIGIFCGDITREYLKNLEIEQTITRKEEENLEQEEEEEENQSISSSSQSSLEIGKHIIILPPGSCEDEENKPTITTTTTTTSFPNSSPETFYSNEFIMLKRNWKIALIMSSLKSDNKDFSKMINWAKKHQLDHGGDFFFIHQELWDKILEEVPDYVSHSQIEILHPNSIFLPLGLGSNNNQDEENKEIIIKVTMDIKAVFSQIKADLSDLEN